MRMLFTSNHDKNAWEGTQFEAFGDALESAIVLSFVSKGMPLIYNGQEAGNPKRLAFFEKDPIEWRKHPLEDLFRRLITLKKSNPALWNGGWGADMVQVTNNEPSSVFSFVRLGDSNKVLGLFNFSNQARELQLIEGPWQGSYRDFASGEEQVLRSGSGLLLPAWGYRILVQ